MATGVIFDMDRTLLILPVDIIEVRRGLHEWGAPLGLDLPWRPILKDIASVPERLEAAHGVEKAKAFGERAWSILDEFEAKAGGNATARLGALELVHALNGAGVPLALVTNNGRPGALAALHTIGLDVGIFEAVVCRGEAPAPKPSPLPFARALEGLEAQGPLSQVMSIGDAPSDILAAQALARELGPRLRVKSIALTGGFAAPDALAALHPDLIVEELTGLWDTLRSAL